MTMVEELLYETHLRAKGVPFEVVLHAEANDALEKADLLEVPIDGVLKSILLDTGRGEVLAVLPASRRIDKKLIAEVVEGYSGLAGEDELVTHFRSFELGALPPSGALLGIPMYVDATVFKHERVIVSSGRRNESLMLATFDLVKDEDVVAALFTRPQ